MKTTTKVHGVATVALATCLGVLGCRDDSATIPRGEPSAGTSRTGHTVIDVNQGRVDPQGKLKGVRVAILATDGFEQSELVDPRQAYADQGATATVVSPKDGTIQGWRYDEKGDLVRVDLLLRDAKPGEFDALELPGGVINSDRLRLEPDAATFVEAFALAGKPIAAICHGLWTMIDADVVRDRTITSWPSLRADLANAGAVWVNEAVVEDRNFVTSRKPDDIPAFNGKATALFARAKAGKPAIGGGPAGTDEPDKSGAP